MTDIHGSHIEGDLGRLLTAEIRTAVRQAMTDQAIKQASLRKELADEVMGKVSADLAKQIEYRIAREVAQIEARVVEKVRRDLLESWTVATTALREEFEKARGAAPDSNSKPSIQPGLASPEKPVVLASAEAESALARQKVRGGFFTRLSAKVAAWAAFVLTTLLLLLIWWEIATSASGRSGWKSSMQRPLEAISPTPTPTAVLSKAQHIRKDWMEIVTAAEQQLSPGTPLGSLFAEHPFNEQVLCWFNDGTQQELEKLARGSSSNAFQEQLEYAFEPCLTRKPTLRDPRLAIYSAQATVRNVFSRYGSEWESWCAIGNEMGLPSDLIADGFSGPATADRMNLFLRCTGHSSDLTIERYSTAPQYLYVTYLALRELQLK